VTRVGPTDPKGHIVLSDRAIDMLALTVSAQRKHNAEADLLEDKRDVLDVLEAMRTSDYMVIAQGALESAINQLRDLIMSTKAP
jgi:ribosomal silencing factor RsfS